MAQVSAGVRADDGEGVDNNERYEISLGRDCIRANGPISRQTTPIWVTGSSLEQRKNVCKRTAFFICKRRQIETIGISG